MSNTAFARKEVALNNPAALFSSPQTETGLLESAYLGALATAPLFVVAVCIFATSHWWVYSVAATGLWVYLTKSLPLDQVLTAAWGF